MCRECLMYKFLWCKRLTLKSYWLHFLCRVEFGLCFVKNHRQGLWRYHFISEQHWRDWADENTNFIHLKRISLCSNLFQSYCQRSISHPLFESWDNSHKFLSCRDSIHVTLSYDDGQIEKRGRQQIFRLFFERKNLKLYTYKCILAKTTTYKLALIFRNIKWPQNQASRSSWRSFGNRYIRNRKQQALLRNFFPSRTRDILTLLNQKISDFC